LSLDNDLPMVDILEGHAGILSASRK